MPDCSDALSAWRRPRGGRRSAPNPSIPRRRPTIYAQVRRRPGKNRQVVRGQRAAGEARKTRRVLSPTDPYKLYVPVLPDQVGPPKLPDDAAGEGRRLEREALEAARPSTPLACYEMSRRAVRSGRAGLAFVLVLDAIQANPDYEPARRLLGYQKYHDQWHTLYEVQEAPRRVRLERKVRLAAESATSTATKRASASATAAGSRPTTTQNATATSARAGGSRPSTT